MDTRGSILLEASISMILVVFGMVMCWEIIKRSMLEVVLHHAAFLAARDYALGETQREVEADLRQFLNAALGSGQTEKLLSQYRPFVWKESSGPQLLAKVRVQYDAALPFYVYSRQHRRVIHKQHFRMTKKCPFLLAY